MPAAKTKSTKKKPTKKPAKKPTKKKPTKKKPTKKVTKKPTKKTTKKKPMNGFFKMLVKAKKMNAANFRYTNKDGKSTVYRRKVGPTGMVLYKAV